MNDLQHRQHPGIAWLLVVVLLLAQLPLLLNPGYFSHDELQWAVFAERGQAFSWLGTEAFQYRPLTFNLWSWLSRHLFEQPQMFHAVLVAWGTTNAAMLYALSRRFGVAAWPAAIGAAVFALSPFAVYTHGWVGTLGDLAWVSAALLIGLVLVRRPGATVAILVSALLTGIALLAKEAALSIPALLALAWWFDGRKRSWGLATLAAGAIAAAYLALRLGVLLHAPREGAQYSLSVWHLPLRWVEYQLFAPIPSVFEIAMTFGRGVNTRIIVAALLWLVVLVALWRSSKRLPALLLAGGLATLLPVLLLASSWNHYGYGFAAFTAAVVAAAWQPAPRWGRATIVLFALLTVWHGVNVMRQMREVGDIQAVFSPALANILRDRTSQAQLRLRPSADAKEWIFQRLTRQVPAYGGITIEQRVQVVAKDAPADLLIQADGRLSSLP